MPCYSHPGQGADLMCSTECNALYWQAIDRVEESIRDAERHANDVCFEEDIRRLLDGRWVEEEE